MRKVQLITAIFSILLISQNALADDYDFRKTRWGMSQKEIMKSEIKKPECINCTGDGSEHLGYRVSVLNKNVMLSYISVQDKLIATSYGLDEKHTNKNDYIEDYKDFKKALIEKYGKPKLDKITWKDNLYKDKISDWGFAVSLGHLEYLSYWETESTNISCSLDGDNYKIECMIIYSSKKLEYLREKKEKKKALDEL
jgi:hypothetical protein